ncbi:MAG: sn-glycerol-3-phosphate ABC transporter substrate-binding protein UgpB [Betaproteobacteria bacterium]|nr:sn-glycerol-3-phosphate ABC transporter substrate-binding protein UgpB [Betaproteobacteria bacterium]
MPRLLLRTLPGVAVRDILPRDPPGGLLLRPIFLTLALLIGAAAQAAPTEIQFWHAMGGPLGDQVEAIAKRFNASQKDYVVATAYKGNYDETMSAAFIAHRAGSAPHIVQVYELGTADMMVAHNAVRHVWEVMAEAGVRLDAKAFVPAVASYFSDAQGRLEGLPFNTSTPVMFYNKDAFREAQLDPEKPPKTWYEMVPILGELKYKGNMPCGYVTSWPSWVLLENTSAWHNQEFATKGNGMGGLDTKLVFNTHLMMRHVSTLASWVKAEYFTYTGRRDEAEVRFTRGACSILTASSATYAELREAAKFDFGVAPLPYYDDIKGAPQNTLIGGGGLWVMNGHKKPEYAGVAKFLAYLSQPEVQAEWHQKTGYVPTTIAAYELTKKQGFYEKNPGHEIAIRQLLLKNPSSETKGIRLGSFPQIRAIIEEELEQVWNLSKTPKQALDEAAERGNQLLRKFEAANKAGVRASSHAPAAAKKAAKPAAVDSAPKKK